MVATQISNRIAVNFLFFERNDLPLLFCC